MANFGTIYMSIDGENLSVKGTINFNNLNLGEKTFEANMDGSKHSVYTPMVATAEITSISACSVPIETLVDYLNRCFDDGETASIIFEMVGSCSNNANTINFVDGEVGGTINFDASTGEVSGIVVGSSDVIVNGTPVRGRN